jgi:hypothetical protein
MATFENIHLQEQESQKPQDGNQTIDIHEAQEMISDLRNFADAQSPEEFRRKVLALRNAMTGSGFSREFDEQAREILAKLKEKLLSEQRALDEVLAIETELSH